MIADILIALLLGAAAGIFGDGDHAFIAEMLQVSMMKFSVPQLYSKLALPKLERELEGVLNLLLHGLYARATAAKIEGARTLERVDH